jgi:hypothetical protein
VQKEKKRFFFFMSIRGTLHHLCDNKKVEDEKHFLFDYPTYTHIRSHFQNISHTTNLPNPNSTKLTLYITLYLRILSYIHIRSKF